MAKINNKEKYPQDNTLSAEDFLIGTDSVTGDTKTFTVGQIIGLGLGTLPTDTFATLTGTIINFPEGNSVDLSTVDTDTFSTINSGVITFSDGSTTDLGSIDTDTFATLSNNILTLPTGDTVDLTDDFATLSGATITFPSGQTITIPDPSTDDQMASEVPVDTSNFTGNLDPTDNTVQRALDKLDGLVTIGGSVYRLDEQNSTIILTENGATVSVIPIPEPEFPDSISEVIDGTLVDTTTFNNSEGDTIAMLEGGKIYIDTTSNIIYRWDGTQLVSLGGNSTSDVNASNGVTIDSSTGDIVLGGSLSDSTSIQTNGNELILTSNSTNTPTYVFGDFLASSGLQSIFLGLSGGNGQISLDSFGLSINSSGGATIVSQGNTNIVSSDFINIQSINSDLNISAGENIVLNGDSLRFVKVNNTPTVGDVWTATGADGSGEWRNVPTGGSVDISGLVPYTGATEDVDLGDNNISLDGITISANGTSLAINTNLGQHGAVRETSIGVGSAENNTGVNVTSVGGLSGAGNTGTNVNFLGVNAGRDNTGDAVAAIGASAADSNAGEDVIAIGIRAAAENTGDNVTALGNNAGASISTDSGLEFNSISNCIILGFDTITTYPDRAAAEAALTVANGAASRNHYVYLNASTNALEFITIS